MISFKANYVTSAQIGELKANNVIEPYKVAITELNPHDKKDNLTMTFAPYSLTRKTGFSWAIFDDFIDTPASDGLKWRKWTKFFALSEEQPSYNYLKTRNILALAEITLESIDEDFIYLDYLQVFKKFFFNKKCFVGKTLLDFIKNKFPDKNIELRSVPSAVKFYQDNGFIETNDIKLNKLTKMRYYHH